MASFKFTSTSGDGCFHIGKSSIFQDGLTFTVKSAIFGVWENESGSPLNKEGTNSIRFKTSISDKDDDAININRFISYRRVIYDKHGNATLLYDCAFHDELLNFLNNEIGRDPNDSTNLVGTAKSVADKVINEFFKDRVIVCRKVEDIFFKVSENGVEKLEAPYNDVFVFDWKS